MAMSDAGSVLKELKAYEGIHHDAFGQCHYLDVFLGVLRKVYKHKTGLIMPLHIEAFIINLVVQDFPSLLERDVRHRDQG